LGSCLPLAFDRFGFSDHPTCPGLPWITRSPDHPILINLLLELLSLAL